MGYRIQPFPLYKEGEWYNHCIILQSFKKGENSIELPRKFYVCDRPDTGLEITQGKM